MAEYIKRIPKAELHIHLEGSISPETALLLADKNKVRLPFTNSTGAKEFFKKKYKDFDEFANVYLTICETLKTAEDFEKVTLDLGADSAKQGIIYREVLFGLSSHEKRGVAWEDIVAGIAAGRVKSKEQYGVEIWFILDISRSIEPDDGVRTVEMAHQVQEKAGIIGIGLHGPGEKEYPAYRHKPAFDRARQLGFNLVAHAGELAGPESVRDTIASLRVDRIDHGVRSIEDEDLVATLVSMQIPLTVCPLCNIALSVYEDLKSHPIKELMDAGVLITVNSDDPPMVRSNLIDNYMQIAECFSLNIDDIEKLVVNGFQAGFISQTKKTGYLKRVKKESASLRAQLFE